MTLIWNMTVVDCDGIEVSETLTLNGELVHIWPDIRTGTPS